MVRRSDEDLPKTTALKRRKYQETSQVIVIPAHLLLAEEAGHLLRLAGAARAGALDEDGVEEECAGVEEDRLCFEEEFGE
jgi:hypothetical protein